MNNLVAIVGRPNVGKSTLFNRLVGMRQAIVDNVSGVTRDRHYGKCEWCGHEFSVVDTGGFTVNSDDVFESAIRDQVMIAIEESDLVIFMVEVATGITDFDAEIADILRRSKKPVLLAVNKVDTAEKQYGVYEFNALGLGEPFSLSS
ncbi:MAG: 50S ribosome-binding GTPase, partial [Bacteroidales bacterium]|nr:50S ribosome-binding GTPase [Bacteroidales bacterium]